MPARIGPGDSDTPRVGRGRGCDFFGERVAVGMIGGGIMVMIMMVIEIMVIIQ